MRRLIAASVLFAALPLNAYELYRTTAQMEEKTPVIVHARLDSWRSDAENPYVLYLEMQALDVFRGRLPSHFTLRLFTGAKQFTAGFPLYEGSELLLYLSPAGSFYTLVSPGMGWNPVAVTEEGRVLMRPVTGYPALAGYVKLEDLRALIAK
jgi:hypothetical protein